MIDMKKSILALALMMSLGVSSVSLASSAPKHRYHPTTQQVDKKETALQADKKSAAQVDEKSKSAEDDEAIEAYSDTTDVDTSAVEDSEDYTPTYHSKYSLGNYDDPFDFFGSVFGGGALIFVIILCILIGLLIFLAPLIVVFVIVRYLYRRHNDRIKLAEMAMEKGVNVPEGSRPIDKQSDEYLQKRGLRNAFLGAGLAVMFGIWGADFLAGIGALVFFYGVGQTVIGSLPAIKKWWNDRHGDANGTGFTGERI